MYKLPLRSYQEKAVDFIVNNEHAFLIALMGAGKTIVTLEAIRRLYEAKKVNGVLIVAPLRVATITWPMEINAWPQFNKLSFSVLHGKHKQGKYFDRKRIYLINYEGLSWLYDLIRETKTLLFDTIVLDESSKIKAFKNTKRLKILRSLGKHMRRKVNLTGTPSPNSPLDLFNQVRFLDDGLRLGNSMSKFREKYFYPLDYKQYNWAIKDGSEKLIEDQIEDLTYTISIEAHEGLKGCIEEDIELDIPEEGKSIYRQMEKQLFADIGKKKIVAANAAVRTSKCLQIVSGAIYDRDGIPKKVHGGKVTAVRRFMESHSNVLVFYQFKFERDMIKEGFPEVEFFGGSNAQATDTLDRWNKGKIKLLAAHAAQIGHGINCQFGGSTVLWFTLPYSREMYEQGNSRVYRSGQTRQVTIYRFITKATVETAVASVLHRRGLSQAGLIEALKLYRGM